MIKIYIFFYLILIKFQTNLSKFILLAVVILSYRKSSKSAYFGRMIKDITLIIYFIKVIYGKEVKLERRNGISQTQK